MATKLYAVSIKHITPFPKSYSVLCEVYGFYDKSDPSILHQIEPSLVSLNFAHDSRLIDKLAPKVRLMVPALGVSEDGRAINSKRNGVDSVHILVGASTAHAEVLNEMKLKEDVVKSSKISDVMVNASRMMVGAELSLFDRIVAKAKALI